MLCDLAVQISVVAGDRRVACPSATPFWLPALFAGTWLVNLVTSVLQSSPPLPGCCRLRSLPVRLLKLSRDYGFVTLVAGLTLTLRPQWTLGLVLALTALNATFLLASIARTLHR